MPAITRPATAEDAPSLALILNRIINKGGMTAHQTPFTAERALRHYIAPERNLVCTAAVVDGATIGFQSLVWPDDDGMPFPDGWTIIATFVDDSGAGQGVGRSLFAATLAAAKAAGVAVIDATIRADNSRGLAFYSALGFVDYDILPAVPLRDGRLVDRVRKRFDL